MSLKDFEKNIEKYNDKYEIFTDRDKLVKYNITVYDLVESMKKYLNDEQKEKVLRLEHIKKLAGYSRAQVIESISSDDIKLKIINDSEIMPGIQRNEILNICSTLSDENKLKLLATQSLVDKYDIKPYYKKVILRKLSEEGKSKLLLDKNLVEEKLKLDKYEVIDLAQELNSEGTKLEIIDTYKLGESQKADILTTFSNESKLKILIENKENIDSDTLIKIIKSLDTDSTIKLIKEHKEVLNKNKIDIYTVTKGLPIEKQVSLVENIENMDLSLPEKRQMLATLKGKTKESIDTSNFPPEYVTAFNMKINEEVGVSGNYQKIIFDPNIPIENYRDLDSIIYINPMEMKEGDIEKIAKLHKVCPEIEIKDEIGLGDSSFNEFNSGEKWIKSVLGGIDQNWSDIQKVAYVDNAIGKKISYSPDFDTEVSNIEDARALWKIIDSGYGVCNGISQVEKYILDKLEIESEIISGQRHAFLLLKNMKIPQGSSEIVGDTILDPTWNLSEQRYGAVPNNFCVSYEEIRKNDINTSGKDTQAHKALNAQGEEILIGKTICLNEDELRKVYTSIGIADKDGKFPITKLMEEAKSIDELGLAPEEAMKRQLSLVASYCPEFASCQNSTTYILKNLSLDQENFKYNKCVVNRVYARDDKKKRPHMYVYADLPDSGKKFYYADKNIGQFCELAQEEFEARFECYSEDIERQDGVRPWESTEPQRYDEDLTRSSGKLDAKEGNER